MRAAIQFLAAAWRRWIPAIVVLAVVISACAQDDQDPKATLDARLTVYEGSLRAELNRLWDNMSYTQAHAAPDPARCTAQTFNPLPVTIDDKTRAKDDLGGKMVDKLAYAAPLIEAAHAQWAAFCERRASAVDTVGFLNSRLSAASASLNDVKETLDLRAQSRARG